MSEHSNKDQEFLLPANNLFIALTIFVALLLNWLPWNGWLLALRPDFVALVLLYWCAHKPYRVGIGIAWMVGIIADVADASLFGQHALAYAVLAFGGTVLHRRIQMFDLQQQTMQIFPLLSMSYIVFALIHWKLHGFIAWSYFLGCGVATALWIPLTLLLQNMRQPRSSPDDL
jgi:rod shape-determining protein MreD